MHMTAFAAGLRHHADALYDTLPGTGAYLRQCADEIERLTNCLSEYLKTAEHVKQRAQVVINRRLEEAMCEGSDIQALDKAIHPEDYESVHLSIQSTKETPMNVIGRDGVKDIADATAEDMKALAAAQPDSRSALDVMVDRFLSWPLPDSVCSDGVATMPGHPHRTGTNLLTAPEARAMLLHVLAVPALNGVRTDKPTLAELQEILRPKSQGQCETTLTERFDVGGCKCPTYPGNLGPCLTWHQGGASDHCVYCDHSLGCHRTLSVMMFGTAVPSQGSYG